MENKKAFSFGNSKTKKLFDKNLLPCSVKEVTHPISNDDDHDGKKLQILSHDWNELSRTAELEFNVQRSTQRSIPLTSDNPQQQ